MSKLTKIAINTPQTAQTLNVTPRTILWDVPYYVKM